MRNTSIFRYFFLPTIAVFAILLIAGKFIPTGYASKIAEITTRGSSHHNKPAPVPYGELKYSDKIKQQLAGQASPATSTIQIEQSMIVGRAYEAVMVVEAGTGSHQGTIDVANANGIPIAATIPVEITPDVMASVSSPDMTITRTSPDWQTILPGNVGVWSWSIKPQKPGEHRVTFSLYNKVKVGDANKLLFVKNYPHNINVSATLWSGFSSSFQPVLNFLSTPISLIAAIVGMFTGIATYLHERGKNRRVPA